MSLLRTVLIWLLVIAVAGAGACWLLANFERRTEPNDIGFQGRARTDPWLAAIRVLEQMGMTVREIRSMPELSTLPAAGVLWLPANRHGIAPPLRESVLQWVDSGGFLVIEAEDAHQPDPLLGALSVRRSFLNGQGEAQVHAADTNRKTELVLLAIPQPAPPVRVNLRRSLDIDAHDSGAGFIGSMASVALMLEHGNGRVLVLNDFGWMTRDELRQHDHAEFLWRVAQLQAPAAEVIFFNNRSQPSLAGWLMTNAWACVAGAFALLAVWLWRASIRFGPVAPDATRERRRLLDHLRASGRFLWANGGAAQLLEAAREGCLRRITRAHPDLLAAPEAQRETLLKDLLGLDAARARLLLAPARVTRMTEFMQTVRLYQSVHERLALRQPGIRIKKGNK